jgi:Domain of unknown function (DUF4258)
MLDPRETQLDRKAVLKCDANAVGHVSPTLEPIVSRHARARMQQRGIVHSAIDYLLEFGREHHDHHGAVVVILDRAATERIARSGMARGNQLDALRGLYAVVAADGCVRTVGHRTRRLRRA